MSAATEINRPAGSQRLTVALGVHVGHHEDFARLGVLCNGRFQYVEHNSGRRAVENFQLPEEQLDRFRQMEERLINAHTLGILAIGGVGKPVVVPIIARRAHIPQLEVKTFRTSTPSQNQIRIVVMEGESENPEACVELGTCLVKGLPDGLPLGSPIEVAFECTHDGRLNVTARIPSLQQVVQSQIHRTMGMDEEAINYSRDRLNLMRIQ